MSKFSYVLKQRRQERGLSQAALARAAGRDARRLSEVENEQRIPDTSEVEDYERVLGPLPRPPAQGSIPEGESEWHQQFRCYKRYRVRPERALQSRIKAAWAGHPAAMRRVQGIIEARRAFFEDLPVGSSLEMLASAALVKAFSALTFTVRPQLWGYDLLPICDPLTNRVVGHRSFLAFGLRVGEYYILVIPQLPVGYPDVIRADFTVGISYRGVTMWRAVEFNGSGHSDARDAERARKLPYPVLYFNEAETLSPEFPQEFVRRLLATLPSPD